VQESEYYPSLGEDHTCRCPAAGSWHLLPCRGHSANDPISKISAILIDISVGYNQNMIQTADILLIGSFVELSLGHQQVQYQQDRLYFCHWNFDMKKNHHYKGLYKKYSKTLIKCAPNIIAIKEIIEKMIEIVRKASSLCHNFYAFLKIWANFFSIISSINLI